MQATPNSDGAIPSAADAVLDEGALHLQHLLRAIAAGEATALARLYELTVRLVFARAYSKLRSKEDAEEIVFDVYKYVWQHAAAYDSSRGSVKAWLSIMTKYRAIDRLRRRRADVSFDDPQYETRLVSLGSTAMDPERMLALLQLTAAVHHALQSLKPERRDLVKLAFFEGLTHEEIATTVGMPLGTVKSHVRRALAALQLNLTAAGEAAGTRTIKSRRHF